MLDGPDGNFERARTRRWRAASALSEVTRVPPINLGPRSLVLLYIGLRSIGQNFTVAASEKRLESPSATFRLLPVVDV